MAKQKFRKNKWEAQNCYFIVGKTNRKSRKATAPLPPPNKNNNYNSYHYKNKNGQRTKERKGGRNSERKKERKTEREKERTRLIANNTEMWEDITKYKWSKRKKKDRQRKGLRTKASSWEKKAKRAYWKLKGWLANEIKNKK